MNPAPARRTVETVIGVVVLSVVIVVTVVSATGGWFVLSFGMLTDCTNDYGCGTNGCPPCRPPTVWLGLGAAGQLVMGAMAATLIVRRISNRGVERRWARRPWLSGLVLLALSACWLCGTTFAAQHSYCVPGSPGYADSYCSID